MTHRILNIHPRRFFMERSNGFVSGDKFPENSKIKELYYSEILKNFIADCLEVKMYHYADPLASSNNKCK